MKRLTFSFTFILICVCLHSQEYERIGNKMFNLGAKVGLNSTFPVIHSISIGGAERQNIHLQYKVGVMAAVFGRINIDRFFIQPGISYRYSSGDIRFNLPVEEENPTPITGFDQLTYRIKSLEAPVLIGYKIVNEGPYGLSFMAGPNIKYSYDVSYESNFRNSPNQYLSDSTPWGIGIVCGVGVTLWRFFFDVTYEFGLNQVDSDFKDVSSKEPTENNITIDKRINMLSFSLGFLF